jgi:hypothetical protein
VSGSDAGDAQSSDGREAEAQADLDASTVEPQPATDGAIDQTELASASGNAQPQDKDRHWFAAITSKYSEWRSRKSISDWRRIALHDAERWRRSDSRGNEESRLPPGEEVHLGAVVFVEAFTPSTASRLRKAIEDFPESDDRKSAWLAEAEEGRSATSGGAWSSLGSIRKPGTFSLGSYDPEIPDSVEAVWPHIFYATPSMTLVVATFTIKDEDGDLTKIMRADYETTFSSPIIHIPGRWGRIQRRIPWARPKNIRMIEPNQRAEQNRGHACEAAISKHEDACRNWFNRRFPGVFSQAGSEVMPTIRILLTKENVPFQDCRRQFAPVNLSSRFDVWNSTSDPGWKLSFQDRPRGHRYTITAAARRSDAARSPEGDESGDSTWLLTQIFADNQSSLSAHWAVSCLLSLYTDRLASLRDRVGRRRRISKPVRESKDLGRFLISDGLDASTIVAELDAFIATQNIFRFNVPEYSEDMSAYPANRRKDRQPAELIPALHDRIRAQAERLKRDTDAATSNIVASAELRQSIANTVLQRRVLVLTVASILIALASLYVSIATLNSSSNTGGGKSPTPTPSAVQASASGTPHM